VGLRRCYARRLLDMACATNTHTHSTTINHAWQAITAALLHGAAAYPRATPIARRRLWQTYSHRLPATWSALQTPSLSWKFSGGEYFNESIALGSRYADFMFKLSEKFKTAVSVKYQAPGEELDPETLISVQDDADLQVRADGCGLLCVHNDSVILCAHAHLLAHCCC
jgi:PB1 domain